jgi:probable HAF family extracellular repeat protein
MAIQWPVGHQIKEEQMSKPFSFLRNAFTVAGLLAAAHAQATSSYRIDALDFVPTDINSSGTIVGTRGLAGDGPIVYSGGVKTDLNMLLTTSKPTISDNGLISIRDSWVYDPRTGTLSGGYLDLGGPHSGNEIVTAGINNDGSIVGHVFNYQYLGQPYATQVKNGQLTYLPSLGGPSTATAINNHGLIVGSSQLKPEYMQPEHAYKYDGTTVTDLGLLPGGITSYATAVNDAGQVAGYGSTTGDMFDERGQHAFITSSSGLVDLGLLASDDDQSRAKGINNLGQVVGYSAKWATSVTPQGTLSVFESRAFVYADSEGMQDLNTMLNGGPGQGWVLETAEGISDNGIIFGRGLHNGVSTYFVMTPVPEPGSAVLVGAGLCVVTLARRKSHKGRKGLGQA